MNIRPTVILGAACLAATTLTGTSAQALGTYDPAPGVLAANWVITQTSAGIISTPYNDGTDWVESPNYGLTAEALVSLDRLNESQQLVDYTDAIRVVSDALAENVDNYTTGESFGDAGSVYAGAAGKLAWAVQSTGGDAVDFGGVNLIDRVESTVQPSGRIQDVSGWGDYANVFGQVFASAALYSAASPKAGAALGFLADQQCPAGFFRENFTRDAAGVADDTGCVDGTDKASLDATATAVATFASMDNPPAELTDALTKASDWLVSRQGTNGSFKGNGEVNTNSTGLAGWALGESGRVAEASKAAAWVRAKQLAQVGSCKPFEDKDLNALAYGATSRKAIRENGITPDLVTQTRSATVQGINVLRWAPAASHLNVRFPSSQPEAGTTITAKVSGAAPGSVVCGQTPRRSILSTVGADGKTGATLVLPKKHKIRVSVALPGYKASMVVRTK